LQLLGARWLRSVALLLASVALWQVAGCVIPPQEVEFSQNHLPFIDWAKATPDIDYQISKNSGEVTTFSIENAADDIDGDVLETIWYWTVGDDPPHPEFGELSMTLDAVCQGAEALRNADSMIVEVVISDRPGTLAWRGEKGDAVDPGVDDEGNPLPLIKHVWAVTLTGDCTNGN